ncbi:hypothetical protein KL930_003424 [Ogataea haglerorum]|uniref:Uncharacterized protein n=1 Tax=Ogataea haglerorum TaxID=1937702 RepID=A0AAN6D7J9_9ASCO|nr:uncharacterized protein KL911_003017 [Ogataea haglerorum]KAG7695427.1 hypothetical protein KL915_002817 [Ogataea haglerorum]KAG7695756.1 hypothetical protein KL951_003281 [Ogataea haglerorum]KAG7705820.1 hypothetical protein KL914_003658 [Ogataea haglerorum]KAG7707162.1 hypothetical protein KL950_002822 [Ogataea haglerorum]KAG7718544.1 hypothetical protein KL913_002539 [Ogataea haglerorum]
MVAVSRVNSITDSVACSTDNDLQSFYTALDDSNQDSILDIVTDTTIADVGSVSAEEESLVEDGDLLAHNMVVLKRASDTSDETLRVGRQLLKDELRVTGLINTLISSYPPSLEVSEDIEEPPRKALQIVWSRLRRLIIKLFRRHH